MDARIEEILGTAEQESLQAGKHGGNIGTRSARIKRGCDRVSLFHRFATLFLLALSGLMVGDSPAVPGRVVSGPAVAARTAGPAGDRFVTFGWVSPPASLTTDARVAEMAEAGLTLAMPAWNDSGRREDNIARLDFAAAHGLRCLLWDARFGRFETLDPSSAAGGALLDSIVADYRDRLAFFGYYLGDEPPRSIWPLLESIAGPLRQRDPAHPAWNNLLGRGSFVSRAAWECHTRDYIAALHPAVLCNDHYDFHLDGDVGLFVENVAGLAAMAREAGLPFWAIVQLVQHGPFRALTPGELAWQTSMLLAYGARGIGYFTYWTPAPDTVWNWQPAIISHEGQRSAWYPVVAGLNGRVRAAGETLAGLTWLATVHAGSTPPGGKPFVPEAVVGSVEGRAALGHFTDGHGVRHVLVANSDSLAAQQVALTLRGQRRVWRLGGEAGEWRPVTTLSVPGGERVALDLEPGGLVLLRISGPFSPLGAGRGPGLGVYPRPAHREVSLSVSGLGPGGHVEILDAGGRRVRSWRPGSDEATLSWRGERDRGGSAPPGFYFVRAEDTEGVSVSRLEWLGSR